MRFQNQINQIKLQNTDSKQEKKTKTNQMTAVHQSKDIKNSVTYF